MAKYLNVTGKIPRNYMFWGSTRKVDRKYQECTGKVH